MGWMRSEFDSRQPDILSGQLAQLVRACDSHSQGHRFESCIAHCKPINFVTSKSVTFTNCCASIATIVINHIAMVHVVILAGGKGTRMKSELPKVLHEVKGTPIIRRLLSSIEPVCSRPTIIIGHKGQEVIAATGGKYNYVEQKEQLGTGHALQCARGSLQNAGYSAIVVLMGDHPLVQAATIENMVKEHTASKAAITLATAVTPDFLGLNATFNNFGRIIRNEKGFVARIVEYKDATEEERAVKEVNIGYYCFDADWLWENIDRLGNNNASKEYYLTDMVKIATDQGLPVAAHIIADTSECLGINSPEQLMIVERALEATA